MDKAQRKPLLWPAIFLGAFGLGALLWALWMLVIVHRQRQVKPAEYYPQVAPAATTPSNGPAAGR